ncbi:MAG: F0F1 ATP synthase subunit epsilon [Desulfobacterales bacterium]
MKLKILLPGQTLVEEEVLQVTAEAQNGSLCLLPRHVDFVAALVPGILSFILDSKQEVFYAVDSGVLVKCGADVLISAGNAVKGSELGKLRETVERQYRTLDEREQKALNAMTKIEAGFVRRFLEIQRVS